MTIKEFFDKWNNVGCDFDGVYGFQCVDVFKQFNKDVVGGLNVNGNAIDYWTTYPTGFYSKVANTPTGVPIEGDVMIWGKTLGQYGHIAIFHTGNADKFVSFDQNYPLGSVCHFQSHDYKGVLGWLHPNKLPAETPTADPVTDKTKIDMKDPWGVMEVQAIRSTLNDQKKTIDAQVNTVAGLERDNAELTTQVLVLQNHQKDIADKLGCPNTQEGIMGAIASLIALEDQSNSVPAVDPITQLINSIVSLFKKKGDK